LIKILDKRKGGGANNYNNTSVLRESDMKVKFLSGMHHQVVLVAVAFREE
jgi:hypothetical protein